MNRNDILIEVDEVRERIDEPGLRIYDASMIFYINEDPTGKPTARDNYLDSHITGAGFFDHQAFSDASSQYMYMVLGQEELATRIGEIGIGNDNPVVVYAKGLIAYATRAWWILRYAGHDNVRILNGGFEAWEAAGGATEPGESSYESTSFTPNLRPSMFAGKEEVLAATTDDDKQVVNSLGEESYAQAHIQGSSCLPFTQLTRGMGAFLSNEEIAERLAGYTSTGRTITYCGGGIAATASAVAHLLIGDEDVAVYDGSLSEWAGEGMPMGSAAQ